jgi:formylglycine-generating enzyme required for sulfatase activity
LLEERSYSIEQFRTLLSQKANLDLSPIELTEILWLALQRSENILFPEPSEPALPSSISSLESEVNFEPLPLEPQPLQPSLPPSTASIAVEPPPAEDTLTREPRSLPVKIPEAIALRSRREIGKAIRPLMRKVPSKAFQEIDEAATVLQIAENQIWSPVLKDGSERWLELAIVVERTNVLDVWSDSIAEFQHLMERHGAFRDVRTWQLQVGNLGKPELYLQTASGLKGKARSAKELIDVGGRRLILLLSDCTSRAWRSGSIPDLLKIWTRCNPVTIVQLLPEQYWDRSALKFGFLAAMRSRLPGALSRDLTLEGLSLRRRRQGPQGLRIPVVTMQPNTLRQWANALAATGDALTTGIVLDPKKFQLLEGRNQSPSELLSAKQLVQQFRGTSSAKSQELADMMAVLPVNWSVIRLIQKSMARQGLDNAQDTGALYLAEVFLSGLLMPDENAETHNLKQPAKQRYDFGEGVRDELLASIPISEARQVGDEIAEQLFRQLPQEIQQRVSADIERRYGESLSYFEAFLVPDLPWGEDTAAEMLPFARVTGQVLRRWGGEYARLAEELERGIYSPNPETVPQDSNSDLEIEHQKLFPEDRGDILKRKVVEAYRPRKLLRKTDANALVIQIDAEENRIECIYTGYSILLEETNRIASAEFDQKMTFDMICPHSKRLGEFSSDMHHIFSAKATVNSARGALPFAELADAKVLEWFRDDEQFTSVPSERKGEYSRKNSQGFEPRDQAKGIIARALFYVYTIYENQAESLFFESQKDVLRQWHRDYPSTQTELKRSQRIAKSKQGNLNPFVVDPVLVERIFFVEPETEWQTFEFNIATVMVLSTVEVEVAKIDIEQVDEPLELTPFEFQIATLVVQSPRTLTKYQTYRVERIPASAMQWVEDLGNNIRLEMVSLPAGRFEMGAPTTEAQSAVDERPQHLVEINKPFLMGKYPVTQAQWRSVAALPLVKRKLNADSSRFKGDERPVEQVSWLDAVEFCQRLSVHTGRDYRLPSEAEWEYACRAGTTTPFHFGETITPDLANYNGTETYANGPKGTYPKSTTAVGRFGVANAFGLYDMHGNVLEWCEDHWHRFYQNAPSDGSAWIDNHDRPNEKAVRLLRGGSWDYGPRNCRSAFRVSDFVRVGDNVIGFRVVCSATRT